MMNNKLKYFWYHYIYWPIYNYFYYKSPIFIGTLNIFKIYKDWWDARKSFKIPYLKCYKLNINETLSSNAYFYIETSTNNKWLYFNVHRCQFKLKWGEYVFENVPYICLIWRNKVKWIIGLEAPLYEYTDYSNRFYRNNDLYWESIIQYNYAFNKDIIKTFNNNIWHRQYVLKDTDENGENKIKKEIITPLSALTNKAADKILRNYKIDT